MPEIYTQDWYAAMLELANVIYDVYSQSGITDWPKGRPPYEG